MSEKMGVIKRVLLAVLNVPATQDKAVIREVEKQNSTLGTLFGLGEGDTDEMGAARYENYSNYNDKYSRETWVYSGVFAIANDIAGIPLKVCKVMIKAGKEIKTYIPAHPFLKLLSKPNELMKTQEEFLEGILANAELSGNSYILKDELVNGIPEKLYCMLSHKVEIVRGATKINGYKYTVDGKTYEYLPEEIEHYKYFNPMDAHYGLGSISACRFGIQANEKSGDYNAAFFKNGARPSGAFQTNDKLGGVEYDRLRVQIAENYTGNKNAFKPIILEKGLKYQAIGVNAKDMDFINSKKMTREEILACLGVPPARVGVMEYSNYANMKEQLDGYWRNTITPKMLRLLATLQEILNLYNDGTMLEWDLSNVEAFRKDETKRSEIVYKYWSMGVPMNDLIDWFNLPIKKREKDIGWTDGYISMSVTPNTGGSTPIPNPDEELPVDTETDEEREIKNKENAKSETKLLNVLNRTDEQYDRAEKFVERSLPQERKLTGILKGFFKEQEIKVMKNLNKYKGLLMEENIAGEFILYELIKTENDYTTVKLDTSDINKFTFDLKDEINEYRKRVLPSHRQAVQTEAEMEISRLGLGISFSVDNPRVIKFLNEYGLNEATVINEYTKQKLRDTLVEGLRAGETIEDLASRIRLVYREADISRSTTIARTETIQASNFGALESYRQTDGVVLEWEWLTAKDELVCPDCEEEDGDVHDLKDETVPPYHPNCRCTILPVTEK